MQEIIDFLLLQDYTVRYVVLGTMLIGSSSAVVGCFLFLKKQSLVGDTIAHAVLPGICLAFILFQTKNPSILLLGAIFSGFLAVLLVQYIPSVSKLKPDTSIGLILSWFFGIGILLLTAIQKSGNASQSGLDKYLFGKASSMVENDVLLFSIVCILLVSIVFFLFRPLKLIAFDADFAKAKGIQVSRYNFVLSILTVVSVATGIQAVGVVLMAALLITPAAAARFWTNKLTSMLILAAFFGALSAYLGTFVSYFIPKMPTGPWIVVILSITALFSFLFGKEKGLVLREIKQYAMAKTIRNENILKAIYQLGENQEQITLSFSADEIANHRYFNPNFLQKGLTNLVQKNYLQKQRDKYSFTEYGLQEGKRVTRLHRLWEMYLTTYLNIAPDHVHDDAEAIEHIITPEIEEELVKLLENPKKDPHHKPIPYTNQ